MTRLHDRTATSSDELNVGLLYSSSEGRTSEQAPAAPSLWLLRPRMLP